MEVLTIMVVQMANLSICETEHDVDRKQSHVGSGRSALDLYPRVAKWGMTDPKLAMHRTQTYHIIITLG
jgi:hypothetical protein